MARMGSATARAHIDKPTAVKAPLFRLLEDQLDAPQRRAVVLDLGAASTPMLAFLGEYRSRVQIADLTDNGGLERLNDPEASPAVLAETARSLLPTHDGKAIDIVYCWDTLNYLNTAGISALMEAITERGRPGTLAHALIMYADRMMPAHPAFFVPTPERRLFNKNPATGETNAPRYSPEDLGRVMGGFAIERAVLLANGMQEFLFRLQ